MDKQLLKTETQSKITNLTEKQVLAKLGLLMEQMKIQDYSQAANKIKDLIQKVYKKQLIIAFTGHFSAGKSTMVNELIGESVLPTSPIPTSANLVCIQQGESTGYLHTNQNEIFQLQDTTNLDDIQEYCRNGEEIVKVELHYPSKELHQDVIYMDTPGIDSVDDAHKLSTESGLHLADIIFYVMDYNHVQSEQNFVFTKSLVEKGKKVIAVVNQIDKHDDRELSFQDFKAQTEAAFKNWGVQIFDFYYTSVKDQTLAGNNLDALKQQIYAIISNKNEIILTNALISAEQIISDQFHDVIEQLKSSFNEEIGDETEAELKTQLENAREEKEKHLNNIIAIEDELREQLSKQLKHATIVPYETRQLAQAFLESIQADFRIGFLFSKSKTEEERLARTNKLLDDVKQRASAQLEWHIKDLLLKKSREVVADKVEEVEQVIYEEVPSLTDDILFQLVQPGATLNNQYILQYANDLDAKIKQMYRKYANTIIDKLLWFAKNAIDTKLEGLKTIESQLLSKLATVIHLSEKKSLLENELRKMLHILSSVMAENDVSIYVEKAVEATNFTVKSILALPQKPVFNRDELPEMEDSQEVIKTEGSGSLSGIQAAEKILTGISGMESTVKALKAKIEKLENKQFTVALFGAFSAGKSSFANALMGDYVLPVSPNPTTAAINQIMPPTIEYPHGSVKVIFKKADQLLDDVMYSLGLLGKNVSTIEEAIKVIQTIKEEEIHSKYHVHLSFLQAVKAGYADVEQYLGTEQIVDLPSFNQYVADEQKACFVAKIELYYDCEVTRQGVSLVDTPGADSIHARHTDVAFNYIKNADAIIFITYYNHAFSKADREFLIQLGRVKDSFELDKMFFVVNAIDLANNDAEMNQVIQYVKGRLVEYGVRNPRMYPVSSKKALMEIKQDIENENAKKFTAFKSDFISFMNDDLMSIVTQSAFALLEQAVNRLHAWELQGQKSADEKEQELNRLKTLQVEQQRLIDEKGISANKKALVQETKELMYYVVDRLRLRFYDLYAEAFSPAAFSNPRMSEKEIIKECLQELLDLIQYNYVQELRATGLRVENFIKKEVKAFSTVLVSAIKTKQVDFGLTSPEIEDVNSLTFQDKDYPLPVGHFTGPLSIFKNAKQFFEKGGRDTLRDELWGLVSSHLNELAEESTNEMTIFYVKELEQEMDFAKDQVFTGLNDFYNGLYQALSGSVDIAQLKKTREEITRLLQESKITEEQGV